MKKKIISLVLLIVSILFLSSCSMDFLTASVSIKTGDILDTVTTTIDPNTTCNHDIKETIVKAPTCTETGIGRRVCSICGEVIEEYIIPALGHDYVHEDEIPATCTTEGHSSHSVCSRCGDVVDNYVIPALGHDFSYSTTVVGDDTHTYDVHACSRCSETIRVNYHTNYKLNYGYQYISSSTNYPTKYLKYKELYEKFYLKASEILGSTKDYEASSSLNSALGEGNGYQVYKYNYNSNGLSLEEAAAIYHLFFYECPEFYFLPSGYVSTQNAFGVGQEIIMYIEKEFFTYSVRETYNHSLLDMEEDFATYLEGETREEYIALKIHNFIIQRIDYARVYKEYEVESEDFFNTYKGVLYVKDGDEYKNAYSLTYNSNETYYIYTASDTNVAHSILGVSTEEGGVCESYAKAFSYLTNLYGIKSIIAHGDGGGEGHAWNYVKLSGLWYAVDVTWDDQPLFPNGISYYYMFVNEEDFNASHGSSDATHTPNSSSISAGLNYQPEIPTLASESCEYDKDENKITLGS
ncbi:MAG: hypothetical protein K6G38_03800 [Gammaproteobacteria bacterium]|nr:hypothetical protein [Gammaproteobacteria bacterium]